MREVVNKAPKLEEFNPNIKSNFLQRHRKVIIAVTAIAFLILGGGLLAAGLTPALHNIIPINSTIIKGIAFGLASVCGTIALGSMLDLIKNYRSRQQLKKMGLEGENTIT